MPSETVDSENQSTGHHFGQEKGSSEKGLWSWFRPTTYRNLIQSLVNSRHPPWFDARGVAFGLVVGFGVPVGGHAIALALLRILFRFNFIVAIAFTWVCNPFNMIVVYYGYYWLGSWILGKSAVISLHDFGSLLKPIIEKTYFWEAFSEFLLLGKDLLVRWSVAAAVIAAISGPIGYIVTYRVQKNRCNRTAKKLGVRYERFLKELEDGSNKEPA
jgi:uncharacterized protein